jgi:hypothetical protein
MKLAMRGLLCFKEQSARLLYWLIGSGVYFSFGPVSVANSPPVQARKNAHW